MVATQSQTIRNNLSEGRDTSDNESEAIFPEVLTEGQMTDLDNDDLFNSQHRNERNAIDQRFYEMNRQIGELTNLGLALTQQISSNPRERSGLNVAKTNANRRSDSPNSLRKIQKLKKLFLLYKLPKPQVTMYVYCDELITKQCY